MKKLVFAIVFLFIATPCFATWTLTPSTVSVAGHYVKWKVVCTSDGDALSATDLIAKIKASDERLLYYVQGETLMAMKISPGLTTVAPDTTINVTLSDDEGDALFTITGASNTAISWHDLSNDVYIYIPVMNLLYLALNDIGTSGDQVTLYFITWKESR